MAKQKNNPGLTSFLPKISKWKDSTIEFLKKRKKIVSVVFLIILALVLFGYNQKNKPRTNAVSPKTITAKVDKSFDFSALNAQGKTINTKVKFKVASVEKTNQVVVKDQTFTAKNNKTFLIANLEFKNDASQAINILPGDLVRLTYNNDEENKYAPDLHNNLVSVAAISTKVDRIGFVIPENAKDLKLIVGELDGKKESIVINLSS